MRAIIPPGGHRVDHFERDDGRILRVIPGFRDRALIYRPGKSPRPQWTDDDYDQAAEARHTRADRRIVELSRFVDLEGATLLEVGCGAGLDCLRPALEPVRRVVGIDLDIYFLGRGERAELTRRLVTRYCERLGLSNALDAPATLPLRFAVADIRSLPFPDDSFDLLWSRSALEHMIPLDRALQEMTRVLRPGAHAYHLIDPFYWLRGSHKRGVVDIPWAHARLSKHEFARFVEQTEGERLAARRVRRLETLNPFTIDQYREALEASPFEIVDWQETSSPFAEEVLRSTPTWSRPSSPASDPATWSPPESWSGCAPRDNRTHVQVGAVPRREIPLELHLDHGAGDMGSTGQPQESHLRSASPHADAAAGRSIRRHARPAS